MLPLLLLACGGPAECDLTPPEGAVALPADEGPHEEAVEWWYWTGHLEDDAGRRYGFEETFFGFRLGVYEATLVNVAVTDVDAQRFSFAYSHAEVPPEATGDGFALEAAPNRAAGIGGEDVLHGETDGYVLDLSLSATKPPVLQHEDGYHDYEAGGYTWYYSRERMDVAGTLTVDGEPRAVSGMGWMDHQWGDLLPLTLQGWDWFAIQLDDDREIMLFMVRGGAEAIGGSITDGCETEELLPDEIAVAATGEWTSPHTGCTYPMGWTVRVRDTELTLTPVMEDQELYSDRETYWEGAQVVSGDADGRAYVELAGYCD